MKITVNAPRKPLTDAPVGHYLSAKIVKVVSEDEYGKLKTKNNDEKWEFHVGVGPDYFNVRATVVLRYNEDNSLADETVQAFSDIIGSNSAGKEGAEIDILPERFVGKTVNIEVKKSKCGKYTNLNWLPAGYVPPSPHKPVLASDPVDDLAF
jgi:hypothetical protein